METTINERFVTLIEALGKNPNNFAKILGKGYTSIDSIVKGKTKPSFDLLEAVLEHYPQVSPEWLMRGEGPMLLTSTTPPKQPVAAEPADGYLQEHLKKLENRFDSLISQKDSVIENLKDVIKYQRQLLESKREQSFHKPAIGPASSPWAFSKLAGQNA